MKVRVNDKNLFENYLYLKPHIHKWLYSHLIKEGKFVRKFNTTTQVWEVPDSGILAKVLSAIEELVDFSGARGITWLNENDISKLITGDVKLLPPPKLYNVEDLIVWGSGGNLTQLKADPSIKILKHVSSFTEGKEFARQYLTEVSYSKRVHITQCKEWDTFVVWIRE